MDLTYTAEQQAFRAQARAWLEVHVPSLPLPSLDTAKGFAAHRAWEHVLNAGGWARVPWRVEDGGRGIFRQEPVMRLGPWLVLRASRP